LITDIYDIIIIIIVIIILKKKNEYKEIEKERNEEKTATADARIARVSCKQNELNASIHSSTLLLKTKESEKRKRYAL